MRRLALVRLLVRGHVVARLHVRRVQGALHCDTEETVQCPVAAPMRPASPMRGRATSNDPNEPLEEGEERSPGRRTGKSRPRGKRRPDRKGNWDSFVADEDEEMSEYEGRGSSKRGYDPRRDRSRSRSPRPRTRSPSKSRPRSRSRSPYRQSHRTRDRESLTERERKSSTPAPNPGSSSATVNAAGPSIPTGPRSRTGVNTQPAPTTSSRTVPTPGRGGIPPTGPRGDREPPRGPRNMVGLNTGPPTSAPAMNNGPGWERPQLAFQSYLAAVQSKLDERQGKKKDENTVDNEPNPADTTPTSVKREPDAMDLDAPEECDPGRSYSNTPAPGPSVEGSRVASPAHANARQSSASLHASPLVGQALSLPASSGSGFPHTSQPGQSVQTHPLSLPPRPRSPPRARSPPRGPRATRGLPEKPKGIGPEANREGGTERDRAGDTIDRSRDRSDWGDKGKVSSELERKTHTLVTNSARQVRVPTPRATIRNSLFPELEKELAALEEQRVRLANEHFPLEVALRQAVDELALSTIECRAAEDRRKMTETVLEAMVKGSGLAAGDI
ncbi:hypothetical protein OPQ81_001924 [Rhizoctonia solani]|nr:hypothetical protein OPQ81_001924 [Rhizoctonia solani]